MIGKLIFSACLALALAQEPNPNANDACPADQSHYLLPHEWDCTKFYYCEYGQRYDEARDCAPGTEFSYKLQVCIHPAQANCTLPNVPPTTTTTPEPTTTTTTTTPKPTTTTTTTPKPTTTTTTTTTPKPTTTTTTTTTPKPTTTTTTTTTPKPTTTTTTTTTPKPTTTTTTTTTPKPTTTTTTTTTPKPTTTTTTTTTPKPTTTTTTTTTPKPTTTTTTTTTPKPTTTTTTTTPKPTTTSTTTTTTPKPTTTSTTTTTTPKPTTTSTTTTTTQPTTEDGRLPNGCPEDFSVFQLLPNEKNCSQFFYCNFGELVETDCPEGTLFNPEIQVCDWPWNVDCGADTTQSPTTDASSNTTTSAPSNTTTTTSAPPTSAPSNTTTTTSAPSNTTTTTSAPTTEDGRLPNGCPEDWSVFQLLPNEHDCSKFYYCTNGELVETDCPEGTLFNPEIKVCDWPWNVDCQAVTTQSPTTEASTNTTTSAPSNTTTTTSAPPTSAPSNTTTTTSAPTTEDGRLPNGCPEDFSVSQLLPDEHDCSKFYICNFGEKVEMYCPEGTLFNSEIQVCDWPNNVNCSASPTTTTTESPESSTLPNGCPADYSVFQLLPNEHDCSKFYYCTNGEKVETTCPEGTLFNPEIQVCDYPENVNCDKESGNGSGNGSSNDDRCKNSCNIAPWAVEEDSTSYWRCEGDEAVQVNCAQGLAFNEVSGTCDYLG